MGTQMTEGKRKLHEALLDLRKEMPFSKMTVTGICKRAGVSRYTFYTYFKDKYDLLGDVCHSAEELLIEDYRRLQAENNPDNSPVASYQNLTTACIDIMFDHLDLFDLIAGEGNMDVALTYYRLLLKNLDRLESSYASMTSSKYDRRQLNSFLIMGIASFVSSARAEGESADAIREDARELVADLARGGLFG